MLLRRFARFAIRDSRLGVSGVGDEEYFMI